MKRPAGKLLQIDGRTLRSTGRTLQLATRVTPEFKAALMKLSKQTGWTYSEILEYALKSFVKAG